MKHLYIIGLYLAVLATITSCANNDMLNFVLTNPKVLLQGKR